MRFAFPAILCAPRFGWQPAPTPDSRRQLYEQVCEIGFTGFEWSPRWMDYDGLTSDAIRSLAREVAEFGLCVSGINLNRNVLSRCPEAEEHRRRLFRTIEIAPDLGAEAVIVSLSLPRTPGEERGCLIGDQVPNDEFQFTADLLRKAAEQAEQNGVQLVLELHDDGLLDTPALCLQMLECIGHQNVRINPDLGNLVRRGDGRDDWKEAIERLASAAGYWHIKNYSDGRPSPVWDGDIDYEVALAVMLANGYDGWVSFETYESDDWAALQSQSLHWLRNRLQSKCSSLSVFLQP